MSDPTPANVELYLSRDGAIALDVVISVGYLRATGLSTTPAICHASRAMRSPQSR
jgi:hypothetical protein